jgi:hypothetical protein
MPGYVETIRADRDTIRQAAAAVRRTTIADQYAGGEHPAVAFSMAALLDELARHSTGPAALPDEVRAAVASACREMLEHYGAGYGETMTE